MTKAKLIYTFKAVESATAPIGRYKALKNVEKVLEATSAPNWSKWLRF